MRCAAYGPSTGNLKGNARGERRGSGRKAAHAQGILPGRLGCADACGGGGARGQALAGKLYVRPRPLPRHGRAQTILASKVWSSFDACGDAQGDWRILREPELRMGDDAVVPGVAGWRRERLPEIGNTYPSAAPDWVCEFMHPSIRPIQLGIKQEICAREGAAYLWLVDPDAKTLETLEPRCGRWSSPEVLSEDAQVSSPPFGAAPFPLGKLRK